jgi:Protein of unknown function (DUF2842)
MSFSKPALKRPASGEINAPVRPGNGRRIGVEACLSIRQRKFFGGVAMLIFVIVYALAAMALAQSRPIQEAPGLVQTLSYIVLGLAWTLPLLPLIKWMERRDDKIG